MKAFQNFNHDINKLLAFYKATIYSYDQTEQTLVYQKKSKIPFDDPTEGALLIKQPHFFKYKRSGKIEIRKTLSEIVFVRVVSALEVFLIDLVRDAFLESKEPFKKHDNIQQISQAELLSYKSTTEISSKIINRECRKLSSGGFLDIIKYYKRYFDIDLANFAPGRSKMEEYHDRRHLLVHRLGKTDQQYREKYNTVKQGISIDVEYLSECLDDFKCFSEMVNNQMKYQLQNEYNPKVKKVKSFDRKVLIQVELLRDIKLDSIEPNFEFWANDEFSNFNDILDTKREIGENIIEFVVSGTFRQIKSYLKILRRSERKKLIKLHEKDITKVEPKEKNENLETRVYATRILDEGVLNQIQKRLPIQPWTKGVHKIVASEINVPNKLVSIAIQVLIAKGVFKNQIDGVIIEKEELNEDNNASKGY
ncbi:MAG: hypothetical protein WC760_08255 [Bacteroidia bacterium]|jgi:hypothetical protein